MTDSHSLIRRIVEAAEIDTVVDTRLVVDSIVTSPRLAHENNVMGTMNVLAACGGEGNPVRKVVFKSSSHYYGAEQDDPAFFTEAMDRPHDPRTPIERDIVDAERAVREFALRHPHVTVTVLRFANGLGPGLRTSLSQLFGLPAVPGILGFDPRFQFIHEDDLAGCLEHAVRHDIEGVYNGAADGVLVLSEVAGLLGKSLAPVLPPVGTSLAASALRRAGLHIFARDPRPAALRARPGQPQAQGDGLPLPLHLARGREQAARAPAPGGHPGRPAGGLPLRARPGGVPAPQPERPADRPPTGTGPLEPRSRPASRSRSRLRLHRL